MMSDQSRAMKCFWNIFWSVSLAYIILLGTSAYGQSDRTVYFPRVREYPQRVPAKKNVWIFILAGQSNMAGRGFVEPADTIPDQRILTINTNNELVVAKEPLHFYEPNLAGLDCGLSFARRLLERLDKEVSILLIPAAVGGSSSHQWLGDSVHRGVQLGTNFRQRVSAVSKYGTVKGILWHQGESDTNDQSIVGYADRLDKIFFGFRQHIGNRSLPILIGKLGSFSDNQVRWNAINAAIERYVSSDKNSFLIETGDLNAKDDKIHFDGEGQRTMGTRMADKFLEAIRRNK